MSTPDDHADSFVSKGRLEFLSDGVFAIAMTILVLEIKVPEIADRRSVGELLRALLREGHVLFAYAVSFLLLGVLWANAHRQYHHIRSITKGILAINLCLMAVAALMPFCVALYTRYPLNAGSYLFYFGDIWLSRLGVWAQLWLAERQGALDPALAPSVLRDFRRRNRRGVAILSAIIAWCIAMSLWGR